MKETIGLADQFGPFCSNGEEAMRFLNEHVIPVISKGTEITFDCNGIKNMNSSFSNAMFANLVIRRGPEVLDLVKFSNCNQGLRLFISSAFELGMSESLQGR